MTSRRTLVTSVVVTVLAAMTGAAALAMYQGIQPNPKGHPSGSSSQRQVAIFPAAPGAGAANGSAPSNIAIAQPYPGGGPFEPGPPPFGQSGVAGDGLSTWGVAFKATSDPAAQPDADLIKSAFRDAQKKAETLASATGLKLGKLLAVSDYGQDQPYYTGCLQPVQPKGPLQGQAQILPDQPVPSPCQPQRNLVVWVLLRYQIGA
jgi:Protein of unknown function (DUF541)